jgi:hypothetical protein
MARHCAMFEVQPDSSADSRTWVDSEPPASIHDSVVAGLVSRLRAWAATGHGGTVVPSGHEVCVLNRRGTPDLVVEVLPSSGPRSDRTTKLGWYAQLGVTEHWLVDPQARTLERMLERGGSYFVVEFLANEESFRPPTFPGLEIPLLELWA